MAASAPPSVIGQALVDFAVQGLFPEEESISSAVLSSEDLSAAIHVLSDAKTKLENDIQAIVEETADDVRTWVASAKALQADIARRKTLATDILLRSDTSATAAVRGPSSDEAEAEAEAKARFLTNELNYNLQVRYLLEAIRSVNRLLDQVEQAAGERRILDALRLLEKSWGALDAMPVSKSCRAMRLLDIRAFELKSDVHKVFDHVWNALVHVDAEKGTLSIVEMRADEPMNLSDAVIGLKAYKEVDDRMAQLWHELDKAIVMPRTDLSRPSRPGIYVDDSILGIRGAAEDGIEALYTDLGRLFAFLAARLPPDLVRSISTVMMPDLVARITDVWLASAVPTSLHEMDAFESVIAAAQQFCARLTELHYFGFGRLEEWIENAPRVWLAKRREAALDTVRRTVAEGLGTPEQVERIETQLVSRSEVKELAANGPAAATDQAADWDTAWSDDDDEEGQEDEKPSSGKTADQPANKDDEDDVDGADAWGAWGDDDNAPAEDQNEELENTKASHTVAESIPVSELVIPPEVEATAGADADADADADAGADAGADADEDDAADAWGWGDDDDDDDDDTKKKNDDSEPQPRKAENTAGSTATRKPVSVAGAAAAAAAAPAEASETPTREMTLREKYYISALPNPVLALIASILEEGAALTSSEHEGGPVAAAAAGLFGLPTLVLAMYRAVSPYYYYSAPDASGSMFLYNDAMYLAEQLAGLAAHGSGNDDGSSDATSARGRALKQLNTEAAKLQAFASRAYAREMALQKTVLRDLLGGDNQSVLAPSAGRLGGGGGGGIENDLTDEDADDFVDAAVARVRSLAAAWETVLAPSAWYQAVGALADAVAQKLIRDVLDLPSISQDEAFRLAHLIAKATELDDLFYPPAATATTTTTTVTTTTTTTPLPLTAQYAPAWLRMQYLSEVLQANLREVRYLWMESELSLYFRADEVVDLIRLSFEDNARAREVAREIAQHPHPVAVED